MYQSTEPARYWQQQLIEWGPKVLFAILILVITHFVAKAVQWGIAKLIDRVPVLKRHPGVGGDSVGTELGRLAYWLVWLVGLVIFRSTSLTHAGEMLASMFSGWSVESAAYPLALYLDPGLMCVLAVACVAATPVWPTGRDWLNRRQERWQALPLPLIELTRLSARLAVVSVLLVASAVMLSASTYNPFIYFQF